MYSYALLIPALAALTSTVTCAPTLETRQSGGVLNPVVLCPLTGSGACNVECGLLKGGQIGQCNPRK